MAVVLHHSKARGTDKLILLGIANHDGDGGAWPKVETLARYGNVSERQVQLSVRKLVTSGELVVERNQGGTRRTRGNSRPNLYRINVTCPITCDHTMQHRPRPYPRGAEALSFTTSSPVDLGVNPASPLGAGVNGASPLGVNPASPEPTEEPGHNSPDLSGTDRAREQPADPWVRARAVREARDAMRGWCSWPQES